MQANRQSHGSLAPIGGDVEEVTGERAKITAVAPFHTVQQGLSCWLARRLIRWPSNRFKMYPIVVDIELHRLRRPGRRCGPGQRRQSQARAGQVIQRRPVRADPQPRAPHRALTGQAGAPISGRIVGRMWVDFAVVDQ